MVAIITLFMDELIGPSFEVMFFNKCKMVVKRAYTSNDNKWSQKFNKRWMARIITGETKREGQKTHIPQEPKKKKRELVPLVVGR
jgi:hypothetical protein